MKRYLNTDSFKTVHVLLFLLLGSIMTIYSCTKDRTFLPTAGGPPKIDRVRLSDPTTTDSNLTKVGLGSTVVIVGSNLNNAQYVSFNGYKIVVNPTYATDTYLIVTISDSVPTLATNPNVTNELKVTTPLGEAVFPFQVLPPPPIVDRISNEAALSGDQITLYGKYYFFIDTIMFPGQVPVTSGFTVSPDGASITVTVPDGIDRTQDNGNIIVVSESGASGSGRETRLYDNSGTGMIVDWDTKNSWNAPLRSAWGISEDPNKVVSSWPGISPLTGQFGLINMTIPNGWGWANAKLVAMGAQDNLPLYPTSPSNLYDPNANLSNFDLKFEAATTQPVGDLVVQIWENNGKDFTITLNLKDFIKTSDGKWYTVSANLGDLAASDGTKVAKYKDFTTPGELRVIVANPTATDIPLTMGIDNIRVMRVIQ